MTRPEPDVDRTRLDFLHAACASPLRASEAGGSGLPETAVRK
jgi:hypothetical protein